ncbi:adenylyl-sulfate kinase [Tundrisphaera sp. TA3]|uniref:adenylyl-sulfate kinase n=1 Tax=Tundrisphaera sp. TA3 TaxID=3435775 RepID=UPI003EBA506A
MPPYGGTLVDLLVDDARASEMKARSQGLASLTLDEAALCDLELLAVGAFSPLRGFMGEADYRRVVAESRLADGTFWPVPIALPVDPGAGAEVGKPLALRDVYGNLLAFLHVEEIYPAETSGDAPAKHHAAGRLEVIRTPPHYDFVELRRTPGELREHLAGLGWTRVVAFHARDPIRRVDERSIREAIAQVGGGLLIHAVVGVPRPGDADHYTRVRCHRALVEAADEPAPTVLSLLPSGPPKGVPGESLLHAIIARNFGCTHLIVGPEIPGNPKAHQPEIGVGLYAPASEITAGSETADLSDRQVLDDYLARGIPLPEWYIHPAVAAILAEAHPPRHRQGLTIWFTGLSGSGKSTVAHGLIERLAEHGRNVSFLDGDEIRTHLSRGLSFSKEDRDANINRVGYVAGLINQHGGTTICSVISPYRGPRENARKASRGNFVEVFCDTPIDVCERRDVKGLYARARNAVAEGKGLGFTGVDDPYEAPIAPEVTLDTSRMGVRECADAIIARLIELGYLRPPGHAAG